MAKYLKNKVYLTLPGTGKKRVKLAVKAKPLKPAPDLVPFDDPLGF
jgi:hypothetical protein